MDICKVERYIVKLLSIDNNKKKNNAYQLLDWINIVTKAICQRLIHTWKKCENHKLIHDSNMSGLKIKKIQINYDIALSKVLFLRSRLDIEKQK